MKSIKLPLAGILSFHIALVQVFALPNGGSFTSNTALIKNEEVRQEKEVLLSLTKEVVINKAREDFNSLFEKLIYETDLFSSAGIKGNNLVQKVSSTADK